MYAYNSIIAVIDDGVSKTNSIIRNLSDDLEVHPFFGVKVKKSITQPSSHGTLCAAIINIYAPDSKIVSIKILDAKTHKCNKTKLIKALIWCVKNKVRLINLSLGTINPLDFLELQECINYVTSKGLIIISANNNNNRCTLPASLKNTIGVKCDRNLNNNEYIFNSLPLDGIDITSSSYHLLKSINGDSLYTPICNSFAAPNITAKVHNILKNNCKLTIDQIKTNLYKDSLNFTSDNLFSVNMSSLSNNYWADSIYERNLQVKLDCCLDKIDKPVVLIYNTKNSYLIFNLQKKFFKRKYFAVTASNMYEHILNCHEYIPNNTDIEKFLDYLNKKYNPDIILLNIDNYNYFINALESKSIDIVIDMNNIIEFNNIEHKCDAYKININKFSLYRNKHLLFNKIVNVLK